MSVLAGVTLFRDMPSAELSAIERLGHVSEPADGVELFAQGDPSDALYAIVAGDGRVRIGAVDERGKALMVEIFVAGDVFGEIGIIDAGARTAAAVVEGRVRLFRLPAAAFLATAAAQAPIGITLARILARRLRRTYELFQAASFEPLSVQLARQLLYLGAVSGRRTERGLRLAGRLRQPDLADLLGATPRSIITILNEWRLRKWVAYDGDKAILTLLDEAALRALITHPGKRGRQVHDIAK